MYLHRAFSLKMRVPTSSTLSSLSFEIFCSLSFSSSLQICPKAGPQLLSGSTGEGMKADSHIHQHAWLHTLLQITILTCSLRTDTQDAPDPFHQHGRKFLQNQGKKRGLRVMQALSYKRTISHHKIE